MANPRWKFTPDASQLTESQRERAAVSYISRKKSENGAPVVGEGTRAYEATRAGLISFSP